MDTSCWVESRTFRYCRSLSARFLVGDVRPDRRPVSAAADAQLLDADADVADIAAAVAVRRLEGDAANRVLFQYPADGFGRHFRPDVVYGEGGKFLARITEPLMGRFVEFDETVVRAVDEGDGVNGLADDAREYLLPRLQGLFRAPAVGDFVFELLVEPRQGFRPVPDALLQIVVGALERLFRPLPFGDVLQYPQRAGGKVGGIDGPAVVFDPDMGPVAAHQFLDRHVGFAPGEDRVGVAAEAVEGLLRYVKFLRGLPDQFLFRVLEHLLRFLVDPDLFAVPHQRDDDVGGVEDDALFAKDVLQFVPDPALLRDVGDKPFHAEGEALGVADRPAICGKQAGGAVPAACFQFELLRTILSGQPVEFAPIGFGGPEEPAAEVARVRRHIFARCVAHDARRGRDCPSGACRRRRCGRCRSSRSRRGTGIFHFPSAMRRRGADRSPTAVQGTRFSPEEGRFP